MTDTPVKYRLRLHTKGGFINRFISVDDISGTILLIDGHTVTVAPNYGLLTGIEDEVSTTSRQQDNHRQFDDLDAANVAAKALYDKYLSEGYVDLDAS
jgi:hypothetical protein